MSAGSAACVPSCHDSAVEPGPERCKEPHHVSARPGADARCMRHPTKKREGTPSPLRHRAAAIGIALAVVLVGCADDADDRTTSSHASPALPSPAPELVTTPTTGHEPSPSTAPAAGSDEA